MTASPPSGGWPVYRIALLAYLPVAGAAAVNIFFLSLLLQKWEILAFTPLNSAIIGALAGVPLSWATGIWFRRKIVEAERDN